MKRTFIALPLNPVNELVNIIRSVSLDNWGAKMKWIPANQWHFTLAFIGETDLKVEKTVIEILNDLALGLNRFHIRFNGFGLFPHVHDPKIVWMGIDKQPLLVEFANKIHQELENARVEFDSRPFVPHLTVGRIRKVVDPELFNEQFNSCRLPELFSFELKELIFYQSVLKSNGPVYEPLKRWKLK
ncbi:MAG: RNA 2',3'-cyclic phosphodiesterase [Bacteroidales bacterium]|nr:RNA 2',3'-cyclic phosphodiesterase [Bacteroidales bacterium]